MKYGIVNKSVITDPAITATAKTVYSLLCCYMNKEKECFPSIETMADELNISQRTVQRKLQELIRHNIIVREPAKHKHQSFLTTIKK